MRTKNWKVSNLGKTKKPRTPVRNVAGNARRELAKKSGRKVVTSENYLALTQGAKRVKRVK